MNDYVSIIMVCFRKGSHGRENLFKKSIISLLEDAGYPFELILIDNTENNRGAAAGRNLGASMATGKYLCFTDDDIYFYKGWLKECVGMVNLPGKYIATPIHQPRVGRWELPMVGEYRNNLRAGSNCMVMKREAWEELGEFDENLSPYNFGRKYCDNQARKGYSVLITREQLADDIGFKKHSYDGSD